MTDMPEIDLDQLRADIAAGTQGNMTFTIGFGPSAKADERRFNRLPDLEAAYLARADLVAAKDAEIARLRELLQDRDGGQHERRCDLRQWKLASCTCNHDAVAAYFREIEG